MEILDDYLKKALDEILAIIKEGLSNDDLIGIKISVPAMPEKSDIGLNFRKVSELSSDIIFDLMTAVSQSNSNF